MCRTIVLFIVKWSEVLGNVEFFKRFQHNQEYVIRDQKLLTPGRFYIPPVYGNRPGIKEESAAGINTVQSVPISDLKQKKHISIAADRQSKAFKLPDFALKLVYYYLYKNAGVFNVFEEKENDYLQFKEIAINTILQQALPLSFAWLAALP